MRRDDRTRIGVVGSRGYADLAAVREFIRRLPEAVVVVTGCADGVDAMARESARTFNLTLRVFKADWARYGRAAGPRRNRVLVANVDRLVAFWDGRSPGTAHAIKAAKALGVPVYVEQCDA